MGERLKIYKTIEGQYKEFRPIGYCHLRKHQGYIDDDINYRHRCIHKKCLYLERCKSRNNAVNREREEILKMFVCKVKELFFNKRILPKEYYKLIETKSDLYAQRFLNDLKKEIVYTGIKNNGECEDMWDDEYYDVHIERNKSTIGDIVEEKISMKMNNKSNNSVINKIIMKIKKILFQKP